MEADYDIFELVTVTHDFWLFDAEHYQRKYSTSHDQPLTPGHYIVNWPEHIRTRRFTKFADFHGPFINRKKAEAALDRMRQERVRDLIQLFKKPAKKSSDTDKSAVKHEF